MVSTEEKFKNIQSCPKRVRIPDGFAARFRLTAAHTGCIMLALCLMELLFHLFTYAGFGERFFWPLLCVLPVGAVLSILIGLFPRRAGRWIGFSLLLALGIYYDAQLVYHHIFGTGFSLAQVGMGGDAITSFWRELFAALGDIWYALIALLLPAGAYLLLTLRGVLHEERRHIALQAVVLGAGAILYIGMLLLLRAGGMANYTPYDIYHSPSTPTELSMETLGPLTTARLEIKYMMTPSAPTDLAAELPAEVQTPEPEPEPEPETVTEEEPEAEPEPEIDTSPNILPINFEALEAATDDENLLTLHSFFAARSGTNKNEYTGRFAGKNLILLCAESFSPILIDEELTPTLYRLSHGGFIFENFYTPWESNTTNGEYTFCMGLYPDMSRGKSYGSFEASEENYLPFCLGNMFLAQGGVTPRAYHNNTASYYGRDLTHPNMGYIMRGAGDGMYYTSAWPASDLEMMEQSAEDYIRDNQFLVYYMTFSGHYRYEYDVNAMVRLNWDKVEDLDYSETVKAYLSCNLELEYALQYLMEQLKAAGQLEDTVIVLTADHFPYGLTLNQYSELAGYEVDDVFGKYRSSFILWSADMEDEPVTVTDPCCTADILPTLLNLFGLPYDSRLLMGTDILSDAEPMAILSNGSFITRDVMYDSNQNAPTWLNSPEMLPTAYLEDHISTVKARFAVSAAILANDYYAVVFPDEAKAAATVRSAR